tara:strand:- start:4909 stop:7275 length:2367 start_codon:yes stop_codon:yes gene_type:complete
MNEITRRKIRFRQDWIRENIKYLSDNHYKIYEPNGCFVTREKFPKGIYILRISVKIETHESLTRVSIEPDGPNGANRKEFIVPIKASDTCLAIPIVITRRSRIRIQPTTGVGPLQTTFSVLPTTKPVILDLLRQWTTRKQKLKDKSTGKINTTTNEEILWRTEQIYRQHQIKHRTWAKSTHIKQSKQKEDQSYGYYVANVEPQLKHNKIKMNKWIELNKDAPLISIILPTYNTKPSHLQACIESVQSQSYPYWELCICDDSSTKHYIKEILEEFRSKDSRIKVTYRQKNGHICQASNDALKLATGEFIALLDHDDLLSEDALYWVAQELQKRPLANLIYSDEDKIDDTGERSCPHFKPSFNIELLLSYNFISHLGVYRRDLIEQIGGFRNGLEGSQDYDLALRIILESSPNQIIHIPRVLYHWRIHPESTSSNPNSKDYTTERGLKAIQNFLDEQHRRGGHHGIATTQEPNRFRCQWSIPEKQPIVDLIIPTRDKSEILGLAINSILTKTNYSEYTITIVNNQSIEKATEQLFEKLTRENPKKIKILNYNENFNYSAINNYAVKQSDAEIIGLINNDIEVISDEWLSEMVSHASRTDVGCVGAKLFYSNGTIQHGGVIIGIGGIAGHAHKYFPGDSPGYVDRLKYSQQLSAVTAACLLVRRTIFNEVSGLNEQDLQVAFNDVDFCLRVHARGYRNIFTPYAQLYHHESVSRGDENTPAKRKRFQKEVDFMLNQYDIADLGQLPCDLFYNPNLTQIHENFAINRSAANINSGIRIRGQMKSHQEYYLKE